MILAITSIASFMGPFDGSIVNLALPSIAVSLNATFTELILIPTVYLTVLASLQTVFGDIGDRRGKKNVFVFGLIIFVFGSLLSAVSQTVFQLIFYRVIQGIGAAVMSAIPLAIMAQTISREKMGRAYGINQAFVYAGLSTGPAAGGFLVQLIGWRSIFYVSVPIGIATALLAILYLPKDKKIRFGARFDFPGATAFTSFLVTIILILSGLELSTVELTLLILACVASFIGFVFLERRNLPKPLVDLRLFTKNRIFAAGSATAFTNYFTYSGGLLLASLYLQTVLKFSPANAGIILLVQPIVMTIVAPISGELVERVNARVLSSVGMSIKAIGFFLLSFLGTSSSAQSVWIPLIFVGAGHSLFSAPNITSVMGSVRSNQLGFASAALGTVRSTGQSIGVPIIGSIAASSMPPGSYAQLSSGGSAAAGSIAQLFVTGMDAAFLFCALVSVAGIFTSLVRGEEEQEQ